MNKRTYHLITRPEREEGRFSGKCPHGVLNPELEEKS